MDFKKLAERFRIRHNYIRTSDQTNGKLNCEAPQIDSQSEETEIEEKLKIDWQQIIGFGNFSVVYVGFLNNGADPVAVKVPRACEESNNYIHKNVLKEVAIMGTIGKHENVIDIIGVRSICDLFESANQTFGIITPLCVNGSLQKYLRSKPIDIIVIGEDFQSMPTSSQEEDQASCLSFMSFCELLKFSYEIALGMSYISSKNVIHGDLAARNILLDENKTCKISDFGLSKYIRMEAQDLSSNVVQSSENERRSIAWRWMAIECLEGSNVSTKSDVWAYGVTLWEIFTIGDVPFPRHSWDSEFLENLKSGQLRLLKPKFASTEIHKTMVECWRQNYESRPSFEDLADFFYKLLVSANEKLDPLQNKHKPVGIDKPLLKIREMNNSCDGESPLQLQERKHQVSLRHGASRNISNYKAFITKKYGLKDLIFANKHSERVYFEQINGMPVCVIRYRDGSERGMNVLKALSLVADHPNVVKFIGMFYDKDLIKGVEQLNIVVQSFHNKSMREFFHKNSQDYTDTKLYTNRTYGNEIFRLLRRFAKEIARGMEFISSKQLVQGDLSSKLIFLDQNLTCKIQLSNMVRTVYEGEIYVKTTPDRISWRILATESLKRLEFSTKSDIWSFGILAWEILNLRGIPYGDMHYSEEFPELLASGFRLGSPKIGGEEIHSMLLKCWNTNPTLRPSFTQLAMFFEGIVSQDYYMEISM